MRLPWRFLLGVVLTAGLSASGRAEPAPARAGSVRFLCVAPDLPAKYKRLPNGAYSAIPYDFDECAPPMIYMKRGAEYTPCPFNARGLSRPHAPSGASSSGRAAPKPGGYYAKDTGAGGEFEAPADPAAGNAPAAKPEARKPEAERKDVWRLMAEAPPADGRDYLLCLFQPKGLSQWHPHRSVRVDISPEVFPADRCLFLNCTELPVFAQFGVGTRPLSPAPAGGFALSSVGPDAGGKLLVRIAAGGSEHMTVAFNREVDLPPGGRVVFVAYPALVPRGEPPRVRVKYYPLEQAPSAPSRVSAAHPDSTTSGVL